MKFMTYKSLSLDEGASGMRSKNLYGPAGTFTMMAKLMAGRSAGVCATFYVRGLHRTGSPRN